MNASAWNRGGTAAKLGTALAAVMFIASLSGCATRQPAQPGLPAPGQAPAQAPAQRFIPSPLHGRPFEVIPEQSRLIVLVYRAGPLASLGHNHVIACRCLTGTIYLPRDPLRASFDLRIPVNQFTVDDPELRASEGGSDFPPDVPQSARQGTRHNMLGPDVLRAAKYPDIELRSSGLRPSPDGRPNDILVDVLVWVDGAPHSICVPMHYEIRAQEILVSGEFPQKQTDLGLTPFSALGGALRVRDSLRVRLEVTARRRAG
jgi:hypothetical protein